MGCSCTTMGQYGGYCTGNSCCPGSAGQQCTSSGQCDECDWPTPGCFVKGTLITMFDGTQRKIEDLDQDEEILSYNMETGEIEKDIILQIDSPFHDSFVTIVGEHNKNKNTFDHPYWSVNKKKWVSYAPGETEDKYGFNDVWELEEGDTLLFLTEDKELIESKVESIVVEDLQNTQTYNLTYVKNNNNFFANGYLVHNKVAPSGPGSPRGIPPQPKFYPGGPRRRLNPNMTHRMNAKNEDHRDICPNGAPMIDGACQGDYDLYGSNNQGNQGHELFDECPPCCDNPGSWYCTTNFGGSGSTLIDNCNFNCVPSVGPGACNSPGGADSGTCNCPGCNCWGCSTDNEGPSYPDQPGPGPSLPNWAVRNIPAAPKRRGGPIRKRRGGRIRRR